MTVTLSPAPARPRAAARTDGPGPVLRGLLSLPEVRWAAVATALFALGGIAQLLGAPAAVWWAAYLACYACGGWEPALAGLRALRDRTLDVDLLMVVAALGAAAIGQVLDGALLIVIFATSGALEAWRPPVPPTRCAALLDLAPTRATRLRRDGSEDQVDAADLAVGDTDRWSGRASGSAPTAASSTGRSEVDQATITGEPLPVAKAARRRGVRRHPQRHRRPAGPGRAGRRGLGDRPDRAPWSRRPRRPRRRRSCSSRRSSSATRSAWSSPPWPCSLIPLAFGAALQPTLLRAMTFMIVASPVRGGAGHDAAAAVGDRQRRPARRAGQVRRGDGAARAGRRRRARQDRHPHRGHPARHRRPAAARIRPRRRRPAARSPPRPSTPASTRWPAPSSPPPATAACPSRPRATSPPPRARCHRPVDGHTVEVGAPARRSTARRPARHGRRWRPRRGCRGRRADRRPRPRRRRRRPASWASPTGCGPTPRRRSPRWPR